MVASNILALIDVHPLVGLICAGAGVGLVGGRIGGAGKVGVPPNVGVGADGAPRQVDRGPLACV